MEDLRKKFKITTTEDIRLNMSEVMCVALYSSKFNIKIQNDNFDLDGKNLQVYIPEELKLIPQYT